MKNYRWVFRLSAMLLVLAVAGVASGYWCAAHHVIRSGKGVLILPKRFLTITDSYVNVSAFTMTDYNGHPNLKRALAEHGFDDLLDEARTREFRQTMDRFQTAAEVRMQAARDAVSAWYDESVNCLNQCLLDWGLVETKSSCSGS